MLGVVHPNPRMGTLQERCGPIDIIRLMMVEWLLEIIMSRRSKFALDHEPAFGKETVPVTPDIGVGVPAHFGFEICLRGNVENTGCPSL